MKRTDPIPEPPTAIPPARDEPRASRSPSRLWMIGFCGLVIVVGSAFLVRQTPSSNENGGAVAEVVAPVVAGVSMRNILFDPVTLEIMKGDVVEWKNDDLVPHTATSSSFDSGALASGLSWRHTFTETGSFPYVCTFHPHMKGVVIVK